MDTETIQPAPTGAADTATAEPNEPTGATGSTETASARRLGFWKMAAVGPADLALDAVVAALLLSPVLGLLVIVGGGIGGGVRQMFEYAGWPVIGFLVLAFSFLVLALLPWLLRGIGWVERHRAAAVYGVEITALPRRRTQQRGFSGLLEQWWLDASDSTPWRSLAFLLLETMLAFVFGVIAVAGIGGGLAMLLSGFARWRPDIVYELDLPSPLLSAIGGAALVVGIIAAIGYGHLDRALAPALLGVSDRAAMRRQVAMLAQQRRGAVAAAQDQRVRIERDLHDDVQPRLVSIAMTLGRAKGKLEQDPSAAAELVDRAHQETKEAIAELRRLVQGMQPAVLADRGLDAALSAVAARCPVPTTIDVDLPAGRCTPEAEAVIYFAVSEALTNVAKHAEAKRCAVRVERLGERLIATITDDGRGGARIGARGRSGDGSLPAGGLSGMQDRAVAAGGSVRVASPAGGPTTITVEVPCAS